MNLKKHCLVLFVALFFSVSGFTAEKKTDALNLIASMQIDLDLLSTSIESYKLKISDLQNLISQSQIDLQASQTDLIEQKKLLTDSQDKLARMETQYNELKTIYDKLNYSYNQSKKMIRYYGIGAAAVILAEGIIIALK